MPVVTIEPVPDRTGPLQYVSKVMGSDRRWNVWLRRHPNNVTIINSCSFTEFDSGLQCLHTADEADVNCLMSYGT